MSHIRPAAVPEWVTCLGVHRVVVAGAVRCSPAASTVSVAECLECHHLGSVSGERDEANWCTTPEFDGQ